MVGSARRSRHPLHASARLKSTRLHAANHAPCLADLAWARADGRADVGAGLPGGRIRRARVRSGQARIRRQVRPAAASGGEEEKQDEGRPCPEISSSAPVHRCRASRNVLLSNGHCSLDPSSALRGREGRARGAGASKGKRARTSWSSHASDSLGASRRRRGAAIASTRRARMPRTVALANANEAPVTKRLASGTRRDARRMERNAWPTKRDAWPSEKDAWLSGRDARTFRQGRPPTNKRCIDPCRRCRLKDGPSLPSGNDALSSTK